MATIFVTEDSEEILSIIKDAMDDQHSPTIVLHCAEDYLTQRSATALLVRLGIQQSRIGFQYLQMAVSMYLQDPTVSFCKELYPTVAERYGSNAKSIERSMRAVISSAWESRDSAVWDIFASDGPPSNKVFVATVCGLL